MVRFGLMKVQRTTEGMAAARVKQRVRVHECSASEEFGSDGQIHTRKIKIRSEGEYSLAQSEIRSHGVGRPRREVRVGVHRCPAYLENGSET